MGFFGKLGKVVLGGALGGPVGAVMALETQLGPGVVKGTVDVARQVVKLGSDVYRAIPPEAFAFAGQPLHGLLKHEFEDEIILVGEVAGNVAIYGGLFWPASGPLAASSAILQGAIPLYVAAGSLVGKIDHRLLNDEELEMARYIFRDSLIDREQIILTNLGGLDGRPFVYPTTFGSVLVNLGNAYVHNATIVNGPVLFHELTHVWQAKQRGISEIFLYDTIPDALLKKYRLDEPTPNDQWDEFGTEQQATIVEAWSRGATSRVPDVSGKLKFNNGARGKFSINSPLFRFINGNIRRSEDRARTGTGRSVRQLLADGGHRTMKDMHSTPPPVWW